MLYICCVLEYRKYQKEAINSALYNIKNYKKPFIIQAATGAGKSVIIAGIAKELNEPTLILQPSKEILEQNFNKLLSYGINDVAIYSASMNSKCLDKYVYATIGSIYKKPELFVGYKNVIIDECHLVSPKNITGMYMTFFKNIKCENICGLTATPYRVEQKYIKEGSELYYTASLKMINRIFPFFFKKISYKIETKELIDEKYLSPIIYQTTPIDTSSLVVNSTGADFTEESIEKFWSNDKISQIVESIVNIDKKHKRNLVFCSSIRQATNVLNMANALNINIAMVTGTTPSAQRTSIVNDFKSGKIKHILNVGVFTTGFDVPELDSILLARPTMSLGLYYQMIGRGVRLDPSNKNKILYVYDLSGNVKKMGPVENIRIKKEEGGFKDEIWTEFGRVDERPLFKFLTKKKIQENTIYD